MQTKQTKIQKIDARYVVNIEKQLKSLCSRDGCLTSTQEVFCSKHRCRAAHAKLQREKDKLQTKLTKDAYIKYLEGLLESLNPK